MKNFDGSSNIKLECRIGCIGEYFVGEIDGWEVGVEELWSLGLDDGISVSYKG